ncbi:beta-L-arabinofuranosidase domain-containing protein [Fodinibius sediminis]|uniref:DUF1680 family protein n=1 Tax=Fodinibius sediminis TaxID=1214077 RepID=A0A521F2E9_9BACT|nr:beta-L-arabinofuranosidase domain-containing protein [Fodinibius sediminis]SMO90372.1 DUF1680 family protein [Fodinibius sediminis]
MDRKKFIQHIAGSSFGLMTSVPFVPAKKVRKNAGGRTREKSNDYYMSARAPLKSQHYTALPIGNIQPRGWLLEQLRKQKKGLTGNLDSLYSEVVGPNNGWLGGGGDGWERGPYWLDGLVPLAYILDDQDLKDKAQQWIEWSLNNQLEDGYFGPEPFEEPPEPVRGVQRGNRRDWWPKMVMLKVLKQYYMATSDERVLDLMTRYFRYQLDHLPERPLGHWSFWGNRRGGDNLMMVYWLYNHTGDRFLLELGDLIHKQTFDWTGIFGKGKMARLNPVPRLHTVNIAMGLKEPVIYYQRTHNVDDIRAVKDGLADLGNIHGFVTGLYGADENLHGNNPTQGTEFCTVVEMMYSFEQMTRITGDTYFADYLEKVAFNALPTQHDEEYERRQYFQQTNQVQISDHSRNFFNDANAQLCYGVLNGYPCCTTNMHQGWPKLVQNLWYATSDNGLAAMIYSSSKVSAKVGGGTEITIIEETDYPFDDTVKFNIKSPEPVSFPLELRIPGWASEASIRVNGRDWKQVEQNSGQMVVVDRKWSDGDTVSLEMPMEVQVSRWVENSAGVERGPLVFALKIGETWEQKQPPEENWRIQHPYYEVYTADPWNYGLTKKTVENRDFKVVYDDKQKGNYPWNLNNVPLKMTAKAKKIDEWKLYDHSAGPLPVSGQHRYGQGNNSDAEAEEVVLVPYGATTLRISQFPVVS